MSDPNLIKDGWTAAGLWMLWAGSLGVSLTISAVIATKLSRPIDA